MPDTSHVHIITGRKRNTSAAFPVTMLMPPFKAYSNINEAEKALTFAKKKQSRSSSAHLSLQVESLEVD